MSKGRPTGIHNEVTRYEDQPEPTEVVKPVQEKQERSAREWPTPYSPFGVNRGWDYGEGPKG